MSENNIKKVVPSLKLGEIFQYEIKNVDEIDKVRAFFIKVEKDYYAIMIDEDSGTCTFFDEIPGFLYKGKLREGNQPFNYKEALEYLKSRNVQPTGKMFVEPKKKIKPVSEELLKGLKQNISAYAKNPAYHDYNWYSEAENNNH